MTNLINQEGKELREKLVELRDHFDSEAEHIHKNDYNLETLQAQVKILQEEHNNHYIDVANKLDAQKLEMMKAGRAYDTAADKFGSVLDQNMNIESKITKINRLIKELNKEHKDSRDSMLRYLTVLQPMHTFELVDEVLSKSLVGINFN